MNAKKKILEQAEIYSNKVNGKLDDHFKARTVLDFEAGAKWMQEQDNWISVEDRLPKQTFKNYLCLLQNDMVIICTFHENKVWQVLHTLNEVPASNLVKYWSELPKPPKTQTISTQEREEKTI